MKRVIVLIIFFALFIMFDNEFVKAYDNVCNKGKIQSNENVFKNCGNNNIFLMSDKSNSSYIVASKNFDSDLEIIYAGKVNGIDTFYARQFSYYSVTYDDRGIFTYKNDIYSDLSINGVVFYSGKFEGNMLVNQSKSGFVGSFYNEVGTYLIRQFIGDDLVKAIRVIIPSKNDVDLSVIEAKYGNDIASGNIPYSASNLSFEIGGGRYGFLEKADLSVNDCKFRIDFEKNLIVKNELFNHCLKSNEHNVVVLDVYNSLKRSKSFKYIFKLGSNSASIKLENTVSSSVTTSRRIVIDADAGMGNVLDDEYCLYYWSKNPDDKLTYDDFMTNYELSEHKGHYSSGKGVILRDSYGTYYLYALAKDDNSAVVVRSEEYVLTRTKRITRLILHDYIFVGSLCIGAFLPIFIYLVIRGKDTE